MKVCIEKSTALGKITAPPSKSMAHRYLICGALSEKSEIKNIAFSKDIEATLNCLLGLGCEISVDGGVVTIGKIGSKSITNKPILCNESGSTLRFLIPICLLFDKEITLTGSSRLFSRSLSVYEEICKAQNIKFVKTENSVTVKGKLQSGVYTVRGDISSQFITGLIFALSNLENDSTIKITENLESASYLALTIKALGDFGVRVSRIDGRTIYIKGNQTYKNRSLKVEGDYSNAAFLDAFNYLGGNVLVKGLATNTAQGDSIYKEYFEKINKGRPTLDVSDCPDLAPVLMALAAAKNGCKLIGTHRLKIKESDRGAAMKSELAKFGCKVTVDENTITVHKCVLKTPKMPLFGHNDHRIVMSLAVLCTLTGGVIEGAEAVIKSYPNFFESLKLLGVNFTMN